MNSHCGGGGNFFHTGLCGWLFSCHCENLTLSEDLMGVRVLCCRMDFSDGSSLMHGCGVSGCGDSGGVKKLPSGSHGSLEISGSSANVSRN